MLVGGGWYGPVVVGTPVADGSYASACGGANPLTEARPPPKPPTNARSTSSRNSSAAPPLGRTNGPPRNCTSLMIVGNPPTAAGVPPGIEGERRSPGAASLHLSLGTPFSYHCGLRRGEAPPWPCHRRSPRCWSRSFYALRR
jgi:hypothetical protein